MKLAGLNARISCILWGLQARLKKVNFIVTHASVMEVNQGNFFSTLKTTEFVPQNKVPVFVLIQHQAESKPKVFFFFEIQV